MGGHHWSSQTRNLDEDGDYIFPNMRGTTDNQICSINDFWSPVKVQNFIGSPEASSARCCLA